MTKSFLRHIPCLIPALSAALLMGASAEEKTQETKIPQLTETETQREARLKWFRDAKFGLFIHWGPAAISGEEISWGMKDRIEGGDKHKKVPREEYMNLYKEFNPTQFDADELLELADKAGMKYLVFVAKHHDGFCLWPTKEKRFPADGEYPVHYSIADTPYDKDIVKEVQEATAKHGLKLGWYYSTRDWTHPDYLQGDNKIYNDYYENQVEELLNDYGPVDILWFDHCFGEWDQYTIPRLYEKMYAGNPNLLVNNRAARGLPDAPKEFAPLLHGDYDTPENRMGAFQHGRAWESCMILSPHEDHGGWSYRPGGKTRSLTETLQLLSSCVTGDGNMLLNLAPLPDGSIRPEERAILEGVAPWMETYGEAIYDTRGGPWVNGAWGGSTYKGRHVYLHVFQPTDEPLMLNALPQQVISVTTMGGEKIPFLQDEKTGALSITVPADARDPHVSVLKLTLDADVEGVLYGPALVDEVEQLVPGTMIFRPDAADRSGALKSEGEGEQSVLNHWVNRDDSASWPLEIDSPGTYTVHLTTSATDVGSQLLIACGKQYLHTAVPVTGSVDNFQTYKVGQVTFPNAESIRLLLRPAGRGPWNPVQVREIKLVPSN